MQTHKMQTNNYRYIAVICLLFVLVIGTSRVPAGAQSERSLATVMRDRIPMDKLTPEEREKVQKELDELEKMLAISVSPDTPPVGLRGRVLLPDGSPAAQYYVHTVNIACLSRKLTEEQTRQLPIPLTRIPAMKRRVDGDFTKPDGTFTIKPSSSSPLSGTNVVVVVYDRSGKERLMSKPIVFVARKDMEPLKITLEEGIPVRGKVTHDDGSPAGNRGLYFEQFVKPIIGADLPAMQEMFNTVCGSFSTNETGEYETFLLPGDYIAGGMRGLSERTLTIAETDKEKRFDLTVAAHVMVEAVSP